MSVYAINKLCRDALHDLAFREALKSDPAAAIAPLDLTDEERKALLAGDVARLYEWGCHPYLLGLPDALGSVRPHGAGLQRTHAHRPRARNGG